MQLGMIGLGTMGANFARNAARNGAVVAAYNRTRERTDAFLKAHKSEGTFVPCKTYAYLAAALKPPRAILIMVQAGEAVDAVIAELVPLLTKGDILIDGGNSHYKDTERREHDLLKKGIHFIGMGVSGGEKGALLGPSLMVGGSREAYDHLEPLLKKIAADDGDEEKCVTYIGPGGAGHFVKMVHNGIEYGLMQLLAETYHLLREIGKKTNKECADLFSEWNTDAHLSSYLLEITAKICRKKDRETGNDLLDVIKDTAGQKGTGQWVVEAALHYGVAIPTITAALDARIISSQKELRMQRSRDIPHITNDKKSEGEDLVEDLRSALLLATICTYAQGFDLLEHTSTEERWNLRLADVARIWRGGCIIRSALLVIFQDIFAEKEAAGQRLSTLLASNAQKAWRSIVIIGTQHGIPLPAYSASLSYFDTLRTANLPANLTAAQRDFFGAHGYERIDKPGIFHTEWE